LLDELTRVDSVDIVDRVDKGRGRVIVGIGCFAVGGGFRAASNKKGPFLKGASK